MKDKIKFSVEAYGQKYTAIIPDDSDLRQSVEAIKGLLCAIGYHSDNVIDLLGDSYQEEEVECCGKCDCSNPVTVEKSDVTVKVKYDL